MPRLAWILYGVGAVGLIAVSLATGRRASIEAGEPHYLLTRTHIFVAEAAEPANATDAAFDALFAEAGEPVTLMQRKPRFVLGLLDATIPVIVGVGVMLAILAARRRRFALAGGK